MKLCRLLFIASGVFTGYVFAVLAMLAPWLFICVGIVLVGWMLKKGVLLTAFGTARWADTSDVRKAGMLDGNGLIIGRLGTAKSLKGFVSLFDPRVDSAAACEQFLAMWKRPDAQLVKLSKAVHSAIFAPAGAGKSTGIVIPFLQTCPESCVVIDLKGELASITAKHRREKFGHGVLIVDPFKVVTQTPDSFNPLDWINKQAPASLDECRDLAEALVVRTGQEKDPHWADSAEAWIAGMIAVTVQYGEDDKSLQTVRTLLSNPAKMNEVLKLMCGSDAWGGMLARMGHGLARYVDKELSSTVTTINRFMKFLDTVSVWESTKSSSFDPAELAKGRVTVYLVLPPNHMRAQAALLRMWIRSMLHAVVRAGGLQEENKVHFVLDEAASLGHMEALNDAVDKFRGYGVRCQFYYQSLGQLKTCWPEGRDQTLLSNCTQVYFGVNDNQTAEYVSTRLGESTIVVDDWGKNGGGSVQGNENGHDTKSHSWGWSENRKQQSRKLLKPEEVMTLPARTAITFAPGLPPIATTMVRYYEEGSMNGPSWFRRAWSRAVMWGAALVFVALSGWVAVMMSHAANR